MIESLDAVFYTAIFILPGFLIVSIIDSTNPPKRQSEGIYILKYLSYSIINCASCSWLYSIISNVKCRALYWLSFIGATVFVALIIAFIVVLVKQKGIIKYILTKLKILSIHPIPTAWDYVFSQQKACFMIVTLTDGSKVRGWYSEKSFASSDQDNHDLFLEKGFSADKDRIWHEDKSTIGVYIPNEQIKLIELKRSGKNE